MGSHIGRNIGKMIQTGGGARLRRGIDAALLQQVPGDQGEI